MIEITPTLLLEVLDYDPQTGLFTWRRRSARLFKKGNRTAEAYCSGWNRKYAGQPALNIRQKRGYLNGTIFGQTVKAHRVAWAIFYGNWPPATIDHIDGDTSNNRIVNLRAVSQSENARNQRLHTRNTSGTNGVYWHKATAKWSANITVRGKLKHLGLFTQKDKAIAARQRANQEHGFHPNHGKRASASHNSARS